MDHLIYIPTLGRVRNQITVKWLGAWLQSTVLVAHPDEVRALQDQGFSAVACPAQGHGIAAVRQWILDNAGDRFIMLDDDFKFANRRADDPGKFEKCLDISSAIAKLVAMLDATPLVGLAHRSGANRLEHPVKYDTRVHGAIGVNAVLARQHGWRFDRLRYMEDFDFTLQVLTTGYSTAVYTDTVYDQGQSNAAGGCSLTRTSEGQAQAALDLALEWPGLVQIVRKKGEGMWGERTDVRISWAKALRSS
jgi:hypothetical protein